MRAILHPEAAGPAEMAGRGNIVIRAIFAWWWVGWTRTVLFIRVVLRQRHSHPEADIRKNC